jgi:hypothetical protein
MKARIFLVAVFVLNLLTFFSSAEAQIYVNPPTLGCPNTRVGESSVCGEFSVENLGKKNVFIGKAAPADTDDFRVPPGGDRCTGHILYKHSLCRVTIEFTPGARGDYESDFYVYSYGKHPVAWANIDGRGVAPVVWLSDTDIDFGDQTVGEESSIWVTLKNIGSDTLTVDDISTLLGSGFSQENNCGDSVDAGDSCTIAVSFLPTAAEEYSSDLTITDDASDSPQEVSLTGNGIAPGQPDVSLSKKEVDFGKVAVGGGPYSDEVTVTNIGNATLVFDSITPSGTFDVSHNCPDRLDHDESCEITVSFSPDEAGFYSGSVTLDDNATDSPQTIEINGQGVAPLVTLSVSEIDFGDQTIGKSTRGKRVTLSNVGTGDLGITSINTDDASFSQDNYCGSTLHAMSSCLIRVYFTPASMGGASGHLIITDDAAGSPHTVSLSGNGIDPTRPDIDIDVTSLDFGNQYVDHTSPEMAVNVANTGYVDLNISSIAASADFDETNDCPQTLLADEGCTVLVTFTPRAIATYTGYLTFVDDATDSPQEVSLSGKGFEQGAVDLDLSESIINFGNRRVDTESSYRSVTVTNLSDQDIQIGDVILSGEDSLDFSENDTCQDTTLSSGQTCTVNVRFNPKATGGLKALVELNDTATNSPQIILLEGTGTGSGGGSSSCSLVGGGAPAGFAIAAGLALALALSLVAVAKNSKAFKN